MKRFGLAASEKKSFENVDDDHDSTTILYGSGELKTKSHFKKRENKIFTKLLHMQNFNICINCLTGIIQDYGYWQTLQTRGMHS